MKHVLRKIIGVLLIVFFMNMAVYVDSFAEETGNVFICNQDCTIFWQNKTLADAARYTKNSTNYWIDLWSNVTTDGVVFGGTGLCFNLNGYTVNGNITITNGLRMFGSGKIEGTVYVQNGTVTTADFIVKDWEISGGTVDFQPMEEDLAKGYEAIDNGDGTWSVQEKKESVITGIEIENEPTKKVYYSGEDLDLTGLVVNAVYSDNSKITLKMSEYKIDGFDTTVVGKQTITVTYENYVDNFNVEVLAVEDGKDIPISILKHPESQEVKLGETAVFAVAAEGNDLSYQWQYSTSNGKYWFNSAMEGFDTTSITVEATKKRNGQQYRCIVSDGKENSEISNAATLTILEDLSELKIAKHPENQSAKAGEKVVFTIEAEGKDLSYQWQYSKTGEYWYDSSMEGSDTASLNVAVTKKRDGYQYRCQVMNSFGEKIYSNAGILTLKEDAQNIVIKKHPENQEAQVKRSVTFCVVAEGENLNYQWQYSKTGVYWYDSSMVGSNTASLSVVAEQKRNNYQYRCVISDSLGNSVISEAAVLSVIESKNNITITEQPNSKEAESGEFVQFLVIAEGEELSYRWQYSKNGNYWYDSAMEGSDTATLNVLAVEKRNGQQYRCIITDKYGESIVSEAAILSVNNQ